MKLLTVVTFTFFAVLSVVFANIEDVTSNKEVGEDESGSDEGRIILGREASRGQFPWQAIIRYRAKKSVIWSWLGIDVGPSPIMICGASLITPKHILTAAHCLYETDILDIVLGSITPFDPKDAGRVKPVIERAYFNIGYKADDLSNDVGIIEFTYPVNYTDVIQPIRLPKEDDFVEEGTDVTISGWGQISDFPKVTVGYLNYVDLRTIGNEECKKVFGKFVKDYTVCTTGKKGENVCSGDSGGPLVTYDGAGVATQVGIVSFVAKRGCELSLPSGYVRVATALKWIRKVLAVSNLYLD